VSYIHFVRPNRIENQGHREEFFCAAYELRGLDELDAHTSDRLEALLTWFSTNLVIPKRFNRTRSKGYGRRSTKGLSWFKDEASTAIERSFELVDLLSENGYPIEILRTDRVGYVVYEDDDQVVAEPFSDTPT